MSYDFKNLKGFSKTPSKASKGEIDNGEDIKLAKTAFLLAVVPLTIILLVFGSYYVSSGGSFNENGPGAIWWEFVFFMFVMGPITIVCDLFAIIYAFSSLDNVNHWYSYAAITIVVAEFLLFFAPFLFQLL